MNDLQKRFEETGKLHFITREENGDLIRYFNPEYVRWLESQLTWRNMEDKPEEGQKCAIIDIEGFELIGTYHNRYNNGIKAKRGFFGYRAFPDKDFIAALSDSCVVKWLPIPKLD